MVFIDNLAYSLFAISFAGFLLLYTALSMYLSYRRKQGSFADQLRGAGVPLGLLGVYMLLMGLWGQFTWPLPGSYNMLFYDPLVSFGIVLLAFCLSVKYNVKLEYAGFLSLMAGLMAIGYGAVGYNLGLTQAPIALLGMYLLYGLAGVFAYPVSLIADRLPGLRNRNAWLGWHAILIIFCLLVFLASALSAFVAISAIPAHLLSAP